MTWPLGGKRDLLYYGVGGVINPSLPREDVILAALPPLPLTKVWFGSPNRKIEQQG